MRPSFHTQDQALKVDLNRLLRRGRTLSQERFEERETQINAYSMQQELITKREEVRLNLIKNALYTLYLPTAMINH